MIKKILFVLFLLFPMFVYAEEENIMTQDKFYIEEADYKVRFLDKDKIMMEEKYKTRLIYGSTSQTYFFVRPVNKSYSYSFKGKDYLFKVSPELINNEGDQSFGVSNKTDYEEYTFGDRFVVLKEIENFKYVYNVKFENKTNNIYSYVMGNNPYETKQLTFEIVAPFKLKNKELYFSLDGKNFSKEIENLSITTESDIIIKGIYNKPLEKGKGIYFLMYDPNEEVIEEKSSNNNIYIIGGSILLVGLIAFVVVKKVKK